MEYSLRAGTATKGREGVLSGTPYPRTLYYHVTSESYG